LPRLQRVGVYEENVSVAIHDGMQIGFEFVISHAVSLGGPTMNGLRSSVKKKYCRRCEEWKLSSQSCVPVLEVARRSPFPFVIDADIEVGTR